ncbi:hypothetical protein QOT17_020885 [Balamuthia mandrillaris]
MTIPWPRCLAQWFGFFRPCKRSSLNPFSALSSSAFCCSFLPCCLVVLSAFRQEEEEEEQQEELEQESQVKGGFGMELNRPGGKSLLLSTASPLSSATDFSLVHGCALWAVIV